LAEGYISWCHSRRKHINKKGRENRKNIKEREERGQTKGKLTVK
jgi:hypothetical protein